jgi:hypothetical protein
VSPTTAFEISSGSDLLKSFPTIHESGMTLTIHFCSNCGSTIYKEGDGDNFKGTVIVQAGTLDKGDLELENVNVGAELWVKQRGAWLGDMKGVAQLQEFS